MRKFFGGIFGFVKNLTRQFLGFAALWIPGVFLCVALADMVLLFVASSIVMTGVMTGVAACLSLTFILFSVPTNTRWNVIRFFAKRGVWVDVIVTAVLTYVGFQISVTMGMTALFVGFHVSAFLSIARWIIGVHDRFAVAAQSGSVEPIPAAFVSA